MAEPPLDPNGTRGVRPPTPATNPREVGSAWALQIGSVLGIPIRIHFTFLLLLVWIGFGASARGESPARAIIYVLLLFACVALHELGHATVAMRFGVRTRDIVLYPIGGIARLEQIPQGIAELLIALAGPAVNLVLAGLLTVAMLVVGVPIRPGAETVVTSGNLLQQLLTANLVLFLFNLIPAFPMDGGRVLRAALALKLPADRATGIASVIGQLLAMAGGVAGALTGNWILLFVALFIFMGAGQEAAFFQQRQAVLGHSAREAMITRFDTLAPQDTLARASELLLATHQQDFPVVDAWNRVAGVLPRATLLRGLATNGATAAVLSVMKRDARLASPSDDLEHVLQLLQSDPAAPVLVLDQDRLVGMITLENLAEFIQIAQVRRVAPA